MIQRRNISLWLVFIALVFSAFSCASDPNEGYKFLCTKERNGWQLCNQNRVRYCHIDHFHTGQNCETLGFECLEVGDDVAVCIDKTKTCQGSESKCENNTAYNCYDGNFSVEPCGTAKDCKTANDKAFCEAKVPDCDGKGELHDGKCECDDGYKVDPNDDRNCIAE